MKKYRLHKFQKQIAQIIFLFFILLPITYNLSPITYSYAAVPHLINYQGRLTDSSGTPLNGSYVITFRIYDAEAAGNLLWQETHTGVVIQKGIFSILLGSVTALNLPFDTQYYLAIQVGSDPEMSPRQRITSAGYAIRAEKAEEANNTTTVANVGVSATPAPNKILPLDNNAKLPVAALKVYDSGWFAVTVSTNYTKTHNLGTTKCIIKVYTVQNSDGSGYFADSSNSNISGGAGYTLDICSLTTTQVTLRGHNPSYIASGRQSDNTDWYTANAYARIIMLALE